MKISVNFLVRILGMGALAYVGNTIGVILSGATPTANEILATRLLTLAGAGLGLLTTPRWTLEPLGEGMRYLRSISIAELTAITFGALLGLVFALLLAVPLSFLPQPLGQVLPIALAVGLAYLGAVIFSTRKRDIADLLKSSRSAGLMPQLADGLQPRRFLLDTSVIIDGRIAAVSQTGFLDGTLLVPHFVLAELQTLADSPEDLRRTKGKRGLEMLQTIQKESLAGVEITNVEVGGVQQVDEKLIVLARQYRCPIITNDHNLARVAELQGVKILSINQLADAVRPPVVPGQDIRVTIRDVGREREQGISFLEDGTMIVIEEARRLIGREVSAVVTRVYQTQTGRIVFAQLIGRSQESGVRSQEPGVRSQKPE
jgi:uncharacterized protein YacL